MKNEQPKSGRPGETSQWPRWEGPAENRPSGYLQGEANIFAEDSGQEKKRGLAPEGYERSDSDLKTAVNEALTQDAFLDPRGITVSVNHGIASLEGTVASADDVRRAEDCCRSVDGLNGCTNNLHIAGEHH